MAEREIIQTLIRQLGQSQDERMPEALGIHFADVDERSRRDLLRLARKFAERVNYYYATDPSAAPGNWTSFFPFTDATVDRFLNPEKADTPPHLALFIAFLGLYKQPQKLLNRFTGRHLDFYYQEVLRLKKKAAVPDRAHVLLELKKAASPVTISAASTFSGGKDKSGVELIYAPTQETVINTSKVESLRSLYVDQSGHGTVRYAPIANSSDGSGGKLDQVEPKWRGFGHEDLPLAEVGFAIASPVLRMKEGARKITLQLTLSEADPVLTNNPSLPDAFDLYITGEKNWVKLDATSVTLSPEGILEFQCQVPEGEKAVVDYSPALHGYSYTAQAPIIQVFLRAEGANLGYNDFKGAKLQRAQVSVVVSGVTVLELQNDYGALDARKAFMPFGPQPIEGSRFMVGCEEAFSKKLSALSITVQWLDAPADFSARYKNYDKPEVHNGYFTASVSFPPGTSWQPASVSLFDAVDPSKTRTLEFAPLTTLLLTETAAMPGIPALRALRTQWATAAITALERKQPILKFSKTAPLQPAPGVLTVSLEHSFLHREYREKYVEKVMGGQKPPPVPQEPYTPTIQSIALTYSADSDVVDIASINEDAFANLDVEFFHIAYFGQRREHGYQRNQLGQDDPRVSLLPQYNNTGELLVGLSNLKAGDSVSLLFQVAEGSANPDAPPQDVSWSVLCDNYWQPLSRQHVLRDTTRQLLTSGTTQFVIPAEATTQNTILPAGMIWLRGGVADVTAVCQLLQVAANALEVRFLDQGNEPGHLASVLPAGKITKLKNGLAAVKSVAQPYASFGGRQTEGDNHFYQRVSERLRHKDRCITPWDFERIILEAFPKVHRVKCIPHAKQGCWWAPGHVLIVLVPDLRNKDGQPDLRSKDGMNALQPKVDAETIGRIKDFVQVRAGQQVEILVKNPRYQKIQLDFKVRFLEGYEPNFYTQQLQQGLIKFLSPWAFEPQRELAFGGKIYKSVVLDYVEEIESVDYVRDFKMYAYTEGEPKVDLNAAEPQTPDMILVSDDTHIVQPIP